MVCEYGVGLKNLNYTLAVSSCYLAINTQSKILRFRAFETLSTDPPLKDCGD